MQNLSSITEITIGEKTFTIVFHLGGDLKFLALVLGINAANSNFPCPICTTDKKEFKNFDACTNNKRNIGDMSQNGQTKQPIIDFIPIDRVIIDPLHMRLRITDKAEGSLHRELIQRDSSYNLEGAHNQKKYADYLDRLGIRKGWYVDEKLKQLKFRDLEGKEKEKLFKEINLESLFPDFPNISNKNEVWKQIGPLLNYFKDVNADTNTIRNNARTFLELFEKTYTAANITPYIHLLSHVPKMHSDLKELDLNFNMFSMEGFEKSNSFIIKYFHKCTNKIVTKNSDPILQTIKKVSRIELIRHSRENVRETLSHTNSLYQHIE